MGETVAKEGPSGPQQGSGDGGLILGTGGLNFGIRRASGDDAAFVFAFWLQDYFERSRFAKGISKTLFMRFHHLILERVIARGVVFVACDAEVPSVIYGFACGDVPPDDRQFGPPPTLHYVYVKRRFRRLGVASALVDALGIDLERPFTFTHLTDDGVALRKKCPLAEYNPYAV
jgi:GNAT superfamily N-acetyltransferase